VTISSGKNICLLFLDINFENVNNISLVFFLNLNTKENDNRWMDYIFLASSEVFIVKELRKYNS
jgi:hypothetical protein